MMSTSASDPSSPSKWVRDSAGSSTRLWIVRAICILILGVLSFSIPPIFLTLGSYVYFHSNNVILPGVQVGELELGGFTLGEAEQLIDAKWNLVDDILVIDLDDPIRSWEGKASSFGLSVDAQSTALLAYHQGRGGQGLESIMNMLSVLRAGRLIEAMVSFDAVLAKAHIEALSDQFNLPSQNDSIVMQGRSFIVEEARDGRSVDVLASLDLLIDDPATILLEHRMIPLVMAPIPAERYTTQAAVEKLHNLVDADVSLHAYDPVSDEHFRWSPKDSEFEAWVDIEPKDNEIQVTLVHEPMRAYVDGLNATLGAQRSIDVDLALAEILNQLSGAGGEPILVSYKPSSYVVQPGDNLVSISFEVGMPYWKLNEANEDLARRGLVVGEDLIVPPKDDMLDLPIIVEKRIVISIREQRMWVYEAGELLHEHVISTGIPNSPTLPGIFQINSHFENAYASIWDLTMPHFMGIYDAVPGLTNGIHGLPLLSSGRRLWADVLGNPASYGCIILDLDAAEHLFYWAEEGVVVEIRE